MSDLRALYQEVILGHSKRPRNFRAIEGASHANGYNPLCGDKVTIYVKLEGDRISDVSFQGAGCAISTASASLLTESLKGKTREEADALFEEFHDLVTGKGGNNGRGPSAEYQAGHQAGRPPLGKLEVFAGVSEFPMRVKCATLAWHTLKSALSGADEVATTETDAGEITAAEPEA
jgi:nitrogen fixation protein NifU and related proteins